MALVTLKRAKIKNNPRLATHFSGENPCPKLPLAADPAALCAVETGRDSGLGSLRVSYYHRMKPNRVYPWTVTLPDARRGADEDVTVRLLMAGAQVVPAEQPLQNVDGQAKATFFVTPIAKGWLKGQRLEVLVGGRKVQEIPLASKVVSQRRTLILSGGSVSRSPWLVWYGFHFSLLDYRAEAKGKFVNNAQNIDVTNEMISYVKEAIAPKEAKEFLP